MISKEVWGRYIADKNGSGDVTLLDISSRDEALDDLVYEYERHLTREERRKVFQLFAFKTMALKAETPEDEEKLDAEYKNGILYVTLPKQQPETPNSKRLEVK